MKKFSSLDVCAYLCHSVNVRIWFTFITLLTWISNPFNVGLSHFRYNRVIFVLLYFNPKTIDLFYCQFWRLVCMYVPLRFDPLPDLIMNIHFSDLIQTHVIGFLSSLILGFCFVILRKSSDRVNLLLIFLWVIISFAFVDEDIYLKHLSVDIHSHSWELFEDDH